MRRIAIIPARGGSKRIPDKNIRNFCGQPMISYIIEAAQKSGLFDVVHISTDSPLISDVAASFGAKPDFHRPAHLADDHTPLMPVLKYVVEEYKRAGQVFDQIWLLMACSPMIKATDLQSADAAFSAQEDGYSFIGITEYPAPIEWAYEADAGGKLTPINPGAFATRSQDLPKRFYDAGAFVIYSDKTFEECQNQGSDSNFCGYILPAHKSVDIDTLEDWQLAEKIYRGSILSEV